MELDNTVLEYIRYVYRILLKYRANRDFRGGTICLSIGIYAFLKMYLGKYISVYTYVYVNKNNLLHNIYFY